IECSLGRLKYIVEVSIELIINESLVIKVLLLSLFAAAECVIDSVSQSLESSKSLRHENTRREAGRGSNSDEDRVARSRFFLFFDVDVRRLVTIAEGGHRLVTCGEGYVQTIP